MKSFGQNLAEYGLVLGLVSIVSIGALTTLGNSVSGSLSQTIVRRPAPIAPPVAAGPATLATAPGSVPIVPAANPLSPPVQPVSPAVQTSETPPPIVPEKTLAMGGALATSLMAAQPRVANPASPKPEPKPKPEPLKRGAVPEKKLCLRDGSCLNIPDVMDNTTILEATGGLGGQLTHQYATVLDQVVAQLEKEPKTPENATLVQEIKKLATNGHAVGSEIEKYQDACGTSTSKGQCTLSNNGATPFNSKNSSFKTQLKKVQGLFPKAQTPETIQKIITQSSAEITGIAKGVKIEFVTADAKSDLIDRANTAKIHFNANTICATSGSSTGCTVPPKSR